MNLLVTGGAGFIGSNFIRYWLSKYPDDQITNLDKLTYAGHLSSLKDIEKNDRYTFIQGDICDADVIDKAIEGCNVICHFAAESHVDRSILRPAIFIKTNVLGTQVLLDASVKHKIKRLHFISTDEVFGALPLGKGKFDENTPYNPQSPYSASKAASDHLVRAYYHTFGLPITITNCSNNFGPFQDPEKFLPRLITNLIDGKKLPIYGDGLYVRDWLYVEDHCRAIDVVLQEGKVGGTYVVGGQSEDVNNLTIAKLLLKIFGLDDSFLEFVKDRPGHDRRYAVDWGKINRELSWQPEHNFEERLTETVEWYKKNEWWWKPIKEQSESIYKK